MEAIEGLSEAPVAGKGLRQMLSSIDTRAEQISKLRDYAMDSPKSRKEVIGVLEAYAGRYKGTRRAAKACSAIATILTVSMLEVLQGE
jgi:hypothetical protein